MAVGVVYLSFVDNWQVYTVPLAKVKAWYQRTVQGEPVLSDSVVVPDQDFKDDLNADSLDLFELVMALEEEYKTEIPSEDLENINTVGEIIDYLKGKGIEE